MTEFFFVKSLDLVIVYVIIDMLMAPVVKWLRPRIVVPICMGSNPIRRPIKNSLKWEFFILVHLY